MFEGNFPKSFRRGSIEPTVGRVVHVYGLTNRPDTPLPAFITRLLPGRVNVTVLGDSLHAGFAHQELYHVPLFDPVDPAARAAFTKRRPGVAWAEWMPFQKGQVGKTEEVTRELAARVANLEQHLAALEAV